MDKIDEAANNWNKTKNPKYKYLWYKLIKEWADGVNNLDRWDVSSGSSDRRNVSESKTVR
jgi:hypothetical protein